MSKLEAAYVIVEVFNGDQMFSLYTFLEACDVFINGSLEFDGLTISDFINKAKNYIYDNDN